MTSPKSNDERRSYNRVQAHVTVRPVSIFARAVPRRVNDVSLGGLRCYSDDEYKPGKRLELELYFDDGQSALILAEVVWVEKLPADGPARFDVGMRYLDASKESLALIQLALQREAE